MPDKRDLEPLLNVRQNQLTVIFGDSDSIDTKALAILAANIAALLFINQTSPHLALWQFLILYVPFGLSLLMNFASIWPRRYQGMGVNLDTHPEYLHMDKASLLLQLLADTENAIAHNSRLNKQRLQLCVISIVLTALGFLIMLCII